MRKIAKNEHKTKTAAAVDSIRAAISRGDIKPGERLIVAKLSGEMGMSPTPIREAIRILEAEGLINHRPHLGVSVVDLSPEAVEEVHMLRGLLEELATKLAVPRLTEVDLARLEALAAEVGEAQMSNDHARLTKSNADWHLYIYEASGTEYLRAFLLRLWAIFPWDSIWMIPGRAGQSVIEHAEIMDAMRTRDPDLASKLMRGHVLRNQESSLDYLRSLKAAGERAAEDSPTQIGGIDDTEDIRGSGSVCG